jgi:hypothetical protein
MSLTKLVSAASRLFFFGAFALLGLSLIERIANASGYTILRGAFTGGRLLELAVVLLIFVIAMQVREMREELKRR